MGIEPILAIIFGVLCIVSGAFQAIDPERFIYAKDDTRWWVPTWRIESPQLMRMCGIISVLIGTLMVVTMTLKYG